MQASAQEAAVPCTPLQYGACQFRSDGMHTQQLKSLNGIIAAAAAILFQLLWLSAKE